MNSTSSRLLTISKMEGKTKKMRRRKGNGKEGNKEGTYKNDKDLAGVLHNTMKDVDFSG